MPNPKYYVFDDKHMIIEGMTKEQIINAIAEATGATPASVDDGFITTIVETNNRKNVHIWKGTKAQFEALASIDTDTLYIITDDTSVTDLMEDYEDLQASQQNISAAIVAIQNQLVDTGWIDLTATNLSSETESVGRYRVKNGIAFFDIGFNWSDFVASSDAYFRFALPIDLDTGDSNDVCVALLNRGNNDQNPYLVNAVLRKNQIGGHITNMIIYIPEQTGAYKYGIVGSFSFPVVTSN